MQGWYKREHGFTLIEIVVTIGIIGILAVIAIPNMISWRAERQLQGTARIFYSDLQRAKFTAIREADTVSITINVPSGDYSIFIDSNQNFTLDAGETLIKNEVLLPNVTVQNVNLAGNRTQFNSRGLVLVPGDLQFINQRGDIVQIFLNSIGKLSLLHI